jgi:hypothetical protein
MPDNKTEIRASFSAVRWHDSELIDMHLVRIPNELRYDLSLDLNLITGYTKDGPEMSRHTALFRGCRIIKADFDLLGVLVCGGAIASGTCYTEALEFARRNASKAPELDFPEIHNPLEECVGFLFEMINPGGEMIVCAQDFQLHKTLS